MVWYNFVLITRGASPFIWDQTVTNYIGFMQGSFMNEAASRPLQETTCCNGLMVLDGQRGLWSMCGFSLLLFIDGTHAATVIQCCGCYTLKYYLVTLCLTPVSLFYRLVKIVTSDLMQVIFPGSVPETKPWPFVVPTGSAYCLVLREIDWLIWRNNHPGSGVVVQDQMKIR